MLFVVQVSWEALRKERFFLTPTGLYDDLVRSAQLQLDRQAGESARRQARLVEDEEEEPESQIDTAEESKSRKRLRHKDPWIDLDEFKNISGRKPRNWHRAVQQASEIHLDEMRVLLAMHYDALHLAQWQRTHASNEKKAPQREDSHKIFRSVMDCHRQQKNLRLQLPPQVKKVLQSPADERDWNKLETLREILCSLIEGEQHIGIQSADEMSKIIDELLLLKAYPILSGTPVVQLSAITL